MLKTNLGFFNGLILQTYLIIQVLTKVMWSNISTFPTPNLCKVRDIQHWFFNQSIKCRITKIDKQGNRLCKIRKQEPGYFKFFPIKCCFLWGVSIGKTIFQGCVLDMWCPKCDDMLLINMWFVKAWKKYLWKKPNPPFKKPSHGWKNWAKGGKNGKLHVMKLVYFHEIEDTC